MTGQAARNPHGVLIRSMLRDPGMAQAFLRHSCPKTSPPTLPTSRPSSSTAPTSSPLSATATAMRSCGYRSRPPRPDGLHPRSRRTRPPGTCLPPEMRGGTGKRVASGQPARAAPGGPDDPVLRGRAVDGAGRLDPAFRRLTCATAATSRWFTHHQPAGPSPPLDRCRPRRTALIWRPGGFPRGEIR